MPFYEYHCESCEQRFELFQSITSQPATNCDRCGETGVRRIVFAPAVHFKGDGFYSTNYRDQSYLNSEKNEKPATKGESPVTSAGDKNDTSPVKPTPPKKEEGGSKPATETPTTPTPSRDKKSSGGDSPKKGSGGTSGAKAA